MKASTSYGGALPRRATLPASRHLHAATGGLHAGFGAARGYKKYLVKQPNLAQSIDVNSLDELLQRATSPGAAALPVLKYLHLLNPRQTAYLLEKLPRLQQLHSARYGGAAAWSAEERRTYRVLMEALQGRLCQVIGDMKPKELRQALWGLAVSR